MTRTRGFVLSICLSTVAPLAPAQQFSPDLYSALRWRMIGPFRGGRTVGIAGIPAQPNVFYIAANNGGVWKSTDSGRVWKPIFDDQPTGSIGALAVAPSNPDVIYVGKRRRFAAARLVRRRGHLQIDGCGQAGCASTTSKGATVQR